MKFVINSKQLAAKLQKLGKVINPKSTLPILGCFLFEIKASKLFLVASDTENRMTTSIDLESVEAEGKIAIESSMILNALKGLAEQPITFEINNDNLEVFIHYHNGKYNFIGQNGEEYPEPRPLDEKMKQKLVIPAIDLQYLIEGTRFACADDELRPVMNGVYFDVDKNASTFVASDGHKMIRLESNIKGSEKGSFILPKKGADIIKNLVAKESDDVLINYDLTNANFKIGEYKLTIRFIEGRYPNYNSVIPTNQPNSVEINRKVLLSVVKRVSVLGNKTSGLIAFNFNNTELNVSAQDIDLSTTAEESIEVNYSGIPLKIGFKATFLVEMLTNLISEDISLSFSDPSKAALITPSVENTRFTTTCLLMPMLLND